ncbi:MAG TPA: hypothetical protein VK203_12590 [Nostocaceae cyanobacterium]|nr:hypothetical protein [Nostocaceae cyanobacterium]
MNYVSDAISQIVWHLPVNATFLAQNVTDPNIIGQMQRAWNHFVLTGQIWAFIIGAVVSYLFLKLSKFG